MADISKIKIEDGTYNIKDETARTLIAGLQVPKNYFAGRKFILIGDSYAVGEDGSGGYVTSWEQLLIDYTDIVSADVIKKSQGGAGFCKLGDNRKFQTMLEEVTASNDITDIVVLGGYNDRSFNETQIQTAINEFYNSAKTRFPNAKIHVGFIGCCKIGSNKIAVSNCIRNYKQSCDYVGIHYLNGIEYSLHDYYFVFGNDGVHPNNYGQIYITFNLIQGLLAGSCNIHYPLKNLTITAKSGYSVSEHTHIYNIMKGDTTEVFNTSDNMTFAISPALTLTGRSNWVEVANITGGYIFGIDTDVNMIPVRVMTHSDEGYITSIALLKFMNGKMYVNLGMTINPSTGAYQTYTNLVEIKVDRFHGTFATELC